MGINIMAVVSAVLGVLALLGACGVLFAGVLGGAVLGAAGAGGLGAATGFLGIVGALGSLVTATLYLAFAYGAFYLKPWAWMLGVAAEGVAIFFALISLFNHGSFFGFLFSVVLAGGILYYLFTPPVKQAFGRP
jgi:hypothetical protein